MTKFQKVIYNTAKLVCKNKSNTELISCYKARLKQSKQKKCTFVEVVAEYRDCLKWGEWWNKYNWTWNDEKGHAEWINKHTGESATQKDCDNYWNR
jgi:hypothetical protein